MACNYQHPQWPNFTWDIKALAGLLAEVRHQQGLLLGRMSHLGFELRSEASLEIFTKNIVKSSEIEGEHLNASQVRSSIAQHLGLDIAGLLPPDRYVDGVVEMMLDATGNYQQPLTEEKLLAWHATLFPTGFSGLYPVEVAQWRSDSKGPMQVVSGAIGREKVHYQAPPAKQVPKEMEQFFSWFNLSMEIDSVLKAGIAHFWFIMVHPFDDGNGRIARAIADQCLAASDKIPERFYSMSAQIEKERKEYYAMLQTCQSDGLDLTRWLTWFLQCLARAIKNAGRTVGKILHKKQVWDTLANHSINDRQRKVLNLLFAEFSGKLTAKKYAKITGCSHDTALRDIQKLIECRVLKAVAAGGRSAGYKLVLLS